MSEKTGFFSAGIGFILVIALIWLWSQNSGLKNTIAECNTKITDADQTIADVGSAIGIGVQNSYAGSDAKQILQSLSNMPFTQQGLCGKGN